MNKFMLLSCALIMATIIDVKACSLSSKKSFEYYIAHEARELRDLVEKEKKGRYCPQLYSVVNDVLFHNAQEIWSDKPLWDESNRKYLEPKSHQFIRNTMRRYNDCNLLADAIMGGGVSEVEEICQRNPQVVNVCFFKSSCGEEIFPCLSEYRGIKCDQKTFPLHYALECHGKDLGDLNRDKCIMTIIRFGANLNARDELEETPAHKACSVPQLNALSNKNAKMNEKNHQGLTPAMKYIAMGRFDLATYVVNGRCFSACVCDANRNNVLHYAIVNTKDKNFIRSILLKMLNDNGNGMNSYNNAGKKPLDLAYDFGDLNIINLIQGKIIKLLHSAVKKNQYILVSSLVERYFFIDFQRCYLELVAEGTPESQSLEILRQAPSRKKI